MDAYPNPNTNHFLLRELHVPRPYIESSFSSRVCSVSSLEIWAGSSLSSMYVISSDPDWVSLDLLPETRLSG